MLSLHSSRIGHLVKGKETLLVENGRPVKEAMRKTTVTRHDLAEALRIQGSTTRLADVDKAFLERSGDISIVKRQEDCAPHPTGRPVS